MVQWLRLQAPNAGGPGSIPGQGTSSSHMLQLKIQQVSIKSWCSQISKQNFFKGRGRGESGRGEEDEGSLEPVLILRAVFAASPDSSLRQRPGSRQYKEVAPGRWRWRPPCPLPALLQEAAGPYRALRVKTTAPPCRPRSRPHSCSARHGQAAPAPHADFGRGSGATGQAGSPRATRPAPTSRWAQVSLWHCIPGWPPCPESLRCLHRAPRGRQSAGELGWGESTWRGGKGAAGHQPQDRLWARLHLACVPPASRKPSDLSQVISPAQASTLHLYNRITMVPQPPFPYPGNHRRACPLDNELTAGAEDL